MSSRTFITNGPSLSCSWNLLANHDAKDIARINKSDGLNLREQNNGWFFISRSFFFNSPKDEKNCLSDDVTFVRVI